MTRKLDPSSNKSAVDVIKVPKIPKCNIHEYLKKHMFIAQFLTLFPLQNVRNGDYKQIKFVWKYWRVACSIMLLSTSVLLVIMGTISAFNSNIVVQRLINPLFHLFCFELCCAFITITRRWPKFIHKWASIEEEMSIEYKFDDKLAKKINRTAYIATILAIVEHLLAIVNSIVTHNCQNQFFGIEYYFRKRFYAVFRYFPYNIFAGFLLLIHSTLSTFIWNFGDLFIILISIVMANSFTKITARIRMHIEQSLYFNINNTKNDTQLFQIYSKEFISDSETTFWKDIREDYMRTSKLCLRLDGLMASLVMVSYANNLTFILIQFFISLKHRETTMESIYFFVCFGYVILRVIMVSIYGSKIYEESAAPLHLLNSVPTELYNKEIQRLVSQIHVNPVGLTGHNFFRITRGLVLNVAAAIITYELVLIQFNQTTLEKYNNLNKENSTCF